jgi:uncharacterized protein YdaU (DUF1376 family)
MGRPWFPFWTSDFWGDPRVMAMTYEEVGVYLRLLSLSWDTGHVPADQRLLARHLSMTPRKLEKVWEIVGPCWVSDGNGGLLNPRLEEEREKAEARSAKARESIEKRWAKR